MVPFKVMTFNIRGTHEDGMNEWENRAGLNVETIKKYLPDVIGFQEVQAGNEATYAETLADYACERGPRFIRQTERYHRLPIYWNPERFEKINAGSFYLSETPDEWSLSWGASLVRGANWVRLHCHDTHAEIVVLNTHMDHEHDEARLNGAKLILQRLGDIRENTAIIITGDFNALPGKELHQLFMQAGYHDTYMEAGNDPHANTYHGFKGDDFSMQGIRLDWILVQEGVSRLNICASYVIMDADPPVYPSDHYPLMAELELV